MSNAYAPVHDRIPPAPAPAARPVGAERQHEHEGVGWFAKLVSIGFWGTFASLIVGAAAAAGLLVLFLLPLLGFGYLVFCLIAWTGDRNVE